jgi:hypothetical protein
MSDPRAANSFQLGPKPHEVATFVHDDTIVYDATLAGGAAQVGLAVSIESDNVITLAGSGENVLGKLLSVDSDGFCSVQHAGFMTLPGGDSATLTAGLKIVGDLASGAAEGYIQAVSTEDTVSRGMIIDASDATAVVVKL